MAALNVTLPVGAIPVDGLQVSFKAPCGCNTFDQIVIDGEYYWLCDANKKDLAVCNGVWSSGAMLSVILDVTAKRAYLQNSAITLSRRNFVYISGSTPSLYSTSAGCITLFADESNTSSVRTVRVFDSMFQPGDVLEIYRNCDDSVQIQFTNSIARGPDINLSWVQIPHKYGIAKFIFAPDRTHWIASGDVVSSAV